MSQQTPSEGRRGASKLTYDWYINSSRWERRKGQYYARYPKVCRACGSKENIHLHHHTYVRLGQEHDDDLVPLCEPCHVVVHQLHRATRELSLTAATRQVVGALHPPRKRKKPKVKRPRPTGHRPPPDMVPLGDVAINFGISKTLLRQQGYHHRVPRDKIRQWLAQRPEWMPTAPRKDPVNTALAEKREMRR